MWGVRPVRFGQVRSVPNPVRFGQVPAEPVPNLIDSASPSRMRDGGTPRISIRTCVAAKHSDATFGCVGTSGDVRSATEMPSGDERRVSDRDHHGDKPRPGPRIVWDP